MLHAPSNPRRRGRPKKEDAEIRKLSIRMTPCDNEEIQFEKWFTEEDFIKFIAGRERGEQNGKLHYHIYCETRRSDTWLNNVMYKATRWTPHHPRGNAVFSRSIAHEGTIGYSVKEEDVAYQLGFTSAELDAMIEYSRQYRRDLESHKKRSDRKKQATMKQFIEEAYTHAHDWDPRSLVSFFLMKYQDSDLPFPSKSQIENAVMKVMYRCSPNYVIDYYCRHV